MAFDVTGKITQPISLSSSPVGPPKRPAAQASMLNELLQNASDDDGRNNVLTSTVKYIGDKSVAARLIADHYESDAGVAEALEILYGTPRAPDVEGDPTHDAIDAQTFAYVCAEAYDDDGLQSYLTTCAPYMADPAGCFVAAVSTFSDFDAAIGALKELYGALPSGADTVAPADLKRMFDAVSGESEYAAIADGIADYIADVHAAADVIASSFPSDPPRSDALGALYDAGREYVPLENLCRYLNDCSDDAERIYMVEKLRSSIEDKGAAATAIESVFDSDESFANAVTVLKGFTYVERDDDAGDVYIAPSNPTWRDRWESAYATAKGAVFSPMAACAYCSALVNEATFAALPPVHSVIAAIDRVTTLGADNVGYGVVLLTAGASAALAGGLVGLARPRRNV